MRSGTTALEVLLASALLAVLVLQVGSLAQETRRMAQLDGNHVLAQRRARRAAALLQGHPLSVLLQHATGSPPPALDPALSPRSREIFLPTFSDLSLDQLPLDVLQHHVQVDAPIPLHAYLEELRPGFARLTILVTWRHPSSEALRRLVWVEFLEDPFVWSQS